MKNDIAGEFINEALHQFKDSFARVFHCLEQLDDEQIWWRPNDKMNSVAVLVKHVCGNMRQWTITSVNNTEDKRNRPYEFENDNGMAKASLISLAKNLETDFIIAIKSLDGIRLKEQKRIQGRDVTLLGAIFHALTHLEGHTGQMILFTRWQLGDAYQIFWQPNTEEQRCGLKSITE